jgi:hypothetical protein
MRWQTITVKGSRENESQLKHHQRDNPFFVVSAISQGKSPRAEDRYEEWKIGNSRLSSAISDLTGEGLPPPVKRCADR